MTQNRRKTAAKPPQNRRKTAAKPLARACLAASMRNFEAGMIDS